MQMSSSKKEIVTLLLGMLSGVSVFVALILGFLIVYANNFLMKRRKREFGLYMLLGMGRSSISRILVGETLFIGLISLAAGLLLGVFGSQLMSVIVAKMFEADMSGFTFVFSKTAAVKTVVYFSIMYVVVIVFNLLVISRVKLITLFHAKKNSRKNKNKKSSACRSGMGSCRRAAGICVFHGDAEDNGIKSEKITVHDFSWLCRNVFIFLVAVGMSAAIYKNEKRVLL